MSNATGNFTVRVHPPGRTAADLAVEVTPEGWVIDRNSDTYLGRVNRKKRDYMDKAREIAGRMFVVTWNHNPEEGGAGWHKGTSGRLGPMLRPLAERELARIRVQAGVSGARISRANPGEGE